MDSPPPPLRTIVHDGLGNWDVCAETSKQFSNLYKQQRVEVVKQFLKRFECCEVDEHRKRDNASSSRPGKQETKRAVETLNFLTKEDIPTEAASQENHANLLLRLITDYVLTHFSIIEKQWPVQHAVLCLERGWNMQFAERGILKKKKSSLAVHWQRWSLCRNLSSENSATAKVWTSFSWQPWSSAMWLSSLRSEKFQSVAGLPVLTRLRKRCTPRIWCTRKKLLPRHEETSGTIQEEHRSAEDLRVEVIYPWCSHAHCYQFYRV